jgi:hypothetical protein
MNFPFSSMQAEMHCWQQMRDCWYALQVDVTMMGQQATQMCHYLFADG